jgi:serine O-acetyltransferase
VRVEGRRPEGPDTDWIHLPDPVADAIRGLSSRITALETADEGDDEPAGEVRPLRRAAGGQPDGRSNPSVGPSPAGG